MRKMKAKSLKKPPPISAAQPVRETENDIQFELELCWCVQQLENALNTGKLSSKIGADTEKNLKILKSHTTPLIKKRQVMKCALGDYRGKMKDEEKKMALASKQIKFTTPTETSSMHKSSFVKKSAIHTSGKGFQFNFQLSEDCITEKQTNANHKTNKNSTFISKNLNLTNNSPFKFNFQIDEDNESFNFKELSIKS